MTRQTFFTTRLYLTAGVALGNLSLLFWDHFHGGVPFHHILQREDLPQFSNWWGAILLPLFTWFLTFRIHSRIQSGYSFDKIWYSSLGALVYGILLSVFFSTGNTEWPFYWVMSLFALAFFFPIYMSECMLGCVLGMVYTFGGVLPLLIVPFFASLGALIYLGIRPLVLTICNRFLKLFSTKNT